VKANRYEYSILEILRPIHTSDTTPWW